jgi:hypothetical protein
MSLRGSLRVPRASISWSASGRIHTALHLRQSCCLPARAQDVRHLRFPLAKGD